MTKYKITIQRVVKEQYEMVLDAENSMDALDESRKMVAARNQTSTSGTYSVIKVETKEK